MQFPHQMLDKTLGSALDFHDEVRVLVNVTSKHEVNYVLKEVVSKLLAFMYRNAQ